MNRRIPFGACRRSMHVVVANQVEEHPARRNPIQPIEQVRVRQSIAVLVERLRPVVARLHAQAERRLAERRD